MFMLKIYAAAQGCACSCDPAVPCWFTIYAGIHRFLNRPNPGVGKLGNDTTRSGLGDAESIRQAQLRDREIIALRQTSKRLD